MLLAASCASLVRNDDTEPVKTTCPYTVRSGIHIWDDSTFFPFKDVAFTDDVEYLDGLSSRELEDKAITHAHTIGADGIFIYKRRTSSATKELDAGQKRGDLDVHGFNLEDHGVSLDTLHYSKNINENLIFFRINVRFFNYRKAGDTRH
jgi:hypothetical protein